MKGTLESRVPLKRLRRSRVSGESVSEASFSTTRAEIRRRRPVASLPSASGRSGNSTGSDTPEGAGVKGFPNWECPNWTELPTIRHSLSSSHSRPSSSGEQGRKKRRVGQRKEEKSVVLSSPPWRCEFTRRGDDGGCRGGKNRAAKVYNIHHTPGS